MNRAIKELAYILNQPYDEELILITHLEECYRNSGLVLEIPLKDINLFEGLNFNRFMAKHFFIISPLHRLRTFLTKPYLFSDETYEVTFMTSSNNLAPFKATPDQTWPLHFNQESLRFWQEALEEEKITLKIRHQKDQTVRKNLWTLDNLDSSEEYLKELKRKLLQSLDDLHSLELKKERLKLWQLTLTTKEEVKANDFGIMDLVLLRKVWHNFSLSMSNQALLDKDEEYLQYSQKLKGLSSLIKKSKALSKRLV